MPFVVLGCQGPAPAHGTARSAVTQSCSGLRPAGLENLQGQRSHRSPNDPQRPLFLRCRWGNLRGSRLLMSSV